MSKWLKTLLFAIWGVLLLIPLIGKTFEKWLQDNVLGAHNALATTISNDLIAVGRLRWFNLALVFMSGIVIGVALESLARRSGERKALDARSLGYKFRTLSDSIKASASPTGRPDNAPELRPAIMSALMSAQKFDLWAPGERVFEMPDASFLCEYFSCVGRLLEDGHLDEASREALSWKPFLDREKPP